MRNTTKRTIRGGRRLRILTASSIAWLLAAAPAVFAEGVSTEAGPEGPAQTVHAPAGGVPGPVIVAISGYSGPNSYQGYAAELAQLGYYVVLVDGKDILNVDHGGAARLSKVVARALRAPKALPGKVAVIGFSLGGGGALYNAADMPAEVSMVVAYYPYTRSWARNINDLVKRFHVPVLVLAGGLDRYKECCVVESMQAMEAAARSRGAPFELVVYPEANHGFNLEAGASGEPVRAYRPEDARDAWRRTVEMLSRYQPLR